MLRQWFCPWRIPPGEVRRSQRRHRNPRSPFLFADAYLLKRGGGGEALQPGVKLLNAFVGLDGGHGFRGQVTEAAAHLIEQYLPARAELLLFSSFFDQCFGNGFAHGGYLLAKFVGPNGGIETLGHRSYLPMPISSSVAAVAKRSSQVSSS